MPAAPNSSGISVLDALIDIERNASASPWRWSGVMWCSVDMIIGCTQPSVRPSASAQSAIQPGVGASGYSAKTTAVPSIAPPTTCASRSRCASSGISSRTPVTESVNAPRMRPMVEALKPLSWPRMGTAKLCTSQHIDSSQFTSSRRRMPGADSRSQAVPRGRAATGGGGGCTGTLRADHSVASGSSSSRP